MGFNPKRCIYCGSLTGKKCIATKEHVVPKSKGGNNYYKNKLTCCNDCNNMRGNLSFKDFKKKIKELMKSAENTFKLQTMLVNIELVETYAEKMGDKLYKKIKK